MSYMGEACAYNDVIAAFAAQAVWANSAGVPDSAAVQEVLTMM